MSSNLEIDEVLAALPAYNQHQLSEIQKRVAVLLGIQNGERLSDFDHTNFYGAITTTLFNKCGIHTPPPLQFARMDIAKEYKMGLIEVDGFISDFFAGISSAERTALNNLLCELIINKMYKMGRPISLTTVVRMIKNIQYLFYENFPGYIEAGVQMSVLRKK